MYDDVEDEIEGSFYKLFYMLKIQNTCSKQCVVTVNSFSFFTAKIIIRIQSSMYFPGAEKSVPY